MTIPSNCHTTDREWKPERESLANTIARLGLEPPTFDRQSFVRVMNIASTHLVSPDHIGHKVHWNGCTTCSTLNEKDRRHHMAVFRTFARNEFITYPDHARCQACNAAMKRHTSFDSSGSHAHP